MAIDEDTLESWTDPKRAAVKSAEKTHKKIRNALNDSDTLTDIEFHDFLQGSYANHTIIRDSSDVDIVVRLDEFEYFNLHDLDPEDQEDVDIEEFDYGYDEFRDDVLGVLQDTYPEGTFDPSGNAIEVSAPGLPLDADVLVSAKYKHYYNFPQGYYEGIVFWPTDSFASVVNYPTRHRERGADKQEETDELYKETVRMFKNACKEVVADGYIPDNIVASYFIECLLYNVPPGRYVDDLQERYVKIVDYLKDADFSGWKCQNGVTDLFGSGRTKWDTWHAKLFVDALETYWENASTNSMNARLFQR
jgi:hypothetical protein